MIIAAISMLVYPECGPYHNLKIMEFDILHFLLFPMLPLLHL
jgi:hypothetical protein